MSEGEGNVRGIRDTAHLAGCRCPKCATRRNMEAEKARDEHPTAAEVWPEADYLDMVIETENVTPNEFFNPTEPVSVWDQAELRAMVETFWDRLRTAVLPLYEALRNAGIDLDRPPEPSLVVVGENPPAHSTVLSEMLAFQREERRTLIARYQEAVKTDPRPTILLPVPVIEPFDDSYVLRKLVEIIDPDETVDNLHDLLALATEMRRFWNTH